MLILHLLGDQQVQNINCTKPNNLTHLNNNDLQNKVTKGFIREK